MDKNIEQLLEQLKNSSDIKTKDKKILKFDEVSLDDLEKNLNIERVFGNKSVFTKWFMSSNNSLIISEKEKEFLENLLKEEEEFLEIYNEEDLKVKFITPILNKVQFKVLDKKVRDFYHEELKYEDNNLILTGKCDFFIASGLVYPKNPYFFIQKFSKKNDSNPLPSLLAEMLTALFINKNESSEIKGAYIIGSIWNFVILQKTTENEFKYYISHNFDSTKLEDLQAIYKNLKSIKKEVIETLNNNSSSTQNLKTQQKKEQLEQMIENLNK
jgi:hypothetical protein